MIKEEAQTVNCCACLPYLFFKIGELSQSFDKKISEAFSRLVNSGSRCTEKIVQ